MVLDLRPEAADFPLDAVESLVEALPASDAEKDIAQPADVPDEYEPIREERRHGGDELWTAGDLKGEHGRARPGGETVPHDRMWLFRDR